MKRTLVASLALAAGLTLAVGCQNKNNPGPQANAGALDVGGNAGGSQTPVNYTPAPQPVINEPAVTPAPADHPTVTRTPAAAPGAGKTYVVQKGDTLFSICKKTYGDGKWQRIVDANPGLTPNNLKAGQTINLP